MEKSLKQAGKYTADENLFFSDSLRELIFDLPERSQEIILNRYGVFLPNKMTLEEIGKKHRITRERVRQIIREVLKKIRDKKEHPVFMQIQEKITLALQSNSGIMEESHIISVLGKGNANEEAAARFFLECLEDVLGNELKNELKFSYTLKDFKFDHWKNVKNAAIETLNNHKKPLPFDILFEHINRAKNLDISKEKLKHFLQVAGELSKNAFDKWGIVDWKEISPKGTREKAYLVIKEFGKPLHFREIAKKIDQNRLNKKKTHPQTVHNELIKDSNFVLVGRGIYALVEWGYKRGTVKDVIEEIIKNSAKTLKKEEIIEKVLAVRQVKESTIVINLNNYFSKSKEGIYSIK